MCCASALKSGSKTTQRIRATTLLNLCHQPYNNWCMSCKCIRSNWSCKTKNYASHPDKGLLAPAAFLPIVEDHALAIDIGEWVIDTALGQIETWQAQGWHVPVPAQDLPGWVTDWGNEWESKSPLGHVPNV